MLVIARATIIFLFACTQLLNAQWLATNPGGGGAFNSPVITASGYWAVGSDLSGVYLSKDEGLSWQIIGAAQGLTATHVAAMTAHPDGKLIIGTDNGIYTSLEDGTNLEHTATNGYISALAVSANPNIVYAALHPQWDALSPKLLRSSDAGQSWRVVSSNLPKNLRVVALRTHPVDENAVVVLSGQGRFNTGPAEAWLSNDSGASWFRLAADVGEVMDITYSVDPNNLNRMYVTTLRNNDTGFLYHSEDAGGTWTKLADHTGVILLDSVALNHLRLLEFPVQHSDGSWEGDTGLHESSDGSESWQWFNSEEMFTSGWSNAHNTWGLGTSFQGYMQTLISNPSQPDTVLWVDSQFVYASKDGGRTWRDTVSQRVGDAWKSRGIDNAVPAVITASPADENLIYAGYFDMGLWRSDDGGASWRSLNKPEFSGGWQDAVGGNTLTVVADPTRADVVWAQLAGNLEEEKFLVRSTERGEPGSWQKLTEGLPEAIEMLNGLSVLASSPVTNRTLYVVANHDVYQSTNDGSSWRKVFDCAGCHLTFASDDAVYAGGGAGLWKSKTGDVNTWTQLSLPTARWTADRTPRDWGYVGLTDIAVHGNVLWVAVLGEGFYRSSNGGESWELVKEDIFARTVVIDSVTGEVYTGGSSALYAGGYNAKSQGVMVSSDNGATWRSMNAGLAYPFATMLRISGTSKWLLSPGQGVLKWQ